MADSSIWPPPKSPLSPQKIARLANALGVPANSHFSPVQTSPGSLNDFRRSPTPSSPSFTASTSKYLLHVIPPMKLPHDADSAGSIKYSAPPPTTSGYHAQFHRGIFVPVHATLQSQLWAIAREYALPSTTGLILYLVTASNRSSDSASVVSETDTDVEPGPRLSEDIWKHLWLRVLKAEQRDETPMSTRTLSPLGMGLAARSTPHLHQDTRVRTPSLPTDGSVTPPIPYPSPSTPSSSRSISKWNVHSEPETPGTSLADDAEQLDLPGLHSSSIIPILAKVEFDIDQRKATWFEPWLRSRELNHRKRAPSSSSSLAGSTEGSIEGKRHLLELKLSDKLKPTQVFTPYGQERLLSASPSEYSDEDEDEDDNEDDATARVASLPLAAVNTPPEETPTVPISGEPSINENDDTRPRLSLSIPSALPTPSPSGLSGRVRNIPPPLVLQTNQPESEPMVVPLSEGSTPSTTSLPYLLGPSGEDLADTEIVVAAEHELDDEYAPLRTPAEFEKRGGGVFHDLDLGLEPSMELDESEDIDDPLSNDRLAKQLDEIEKNLAQFSPRVLKDDLEDTASPSASSSRPISGDIPPTPKHRLEFGLGLGIGLDRGSKSSQSLVIASPRSPSASPDSPPKSPPNPPRLAVNGISTSPPRGFKSGSPGGSQGGPVYPPFSPLAHSRNGESPVIPLSPDPFGRYPSTPAPQSVVSESTSDSKSSRFSTDSATQVELVSKRSTVVSVKGIKKLWRKSTKTNSISGPLAVPPTPAIPPTPTLPSTPGHLSVQQPPQTRERSTSALPVTPTFGQFPSTTPPPIRPERPSQEELDIPDIPEQPTFQPYLGRAANPSPIIPTKMLPSNRDHLTQLHFDQESPYPIRRSVVPTRQSSRPPSPSHSPPISSPSPPLPEPAHQSQRNSVRKSILKWKNSASNNGPAPPRGQTPSFLGGVSAPTLPRPERSSILSNGRGRRPSISNPVLTSATDSFAEIPPSPRIPDQFIQRADGGSRISHLTTPSTDSSVANSARKSSLTPRSSSPSQSLASSSRQSGETRPSIDSSHFEMVSPRIGTQTLSYPYNTLDQN